MKLTSEFLQTELFVFFIIASSKDSKKSAFHIASSVFSEFLKRDLCTLLCTHSCLPPYHVECTRTRRISQVKQRRARLVLGSETAWEPRVWQAPVFYCEVRLLLALLLQMYSFCSPTNFAATLVVVLTQACEFASTVTCTFRGLASPECLILVNNLFSIYSLLLRVAPMLD